MQTTPVIYKQNSTIYESGHPIDSVGLIISGSVHANFSEHHIVLEKGDVMGVSELCLDTHALSYTAQSDTTVMFYPFTDLDMLTTLLSSHSDLACLFLVSVYKQINLLFDCYKNSKTHCHTLYENFLHLWEQYSQLCIQYHITPQSLPGMENLASFPNDKDIYHWLLTYYKELFSLTNCGVPDFFLENTGILIGMIVKSSRDFYKTLFLFDSIDEYTSHLLHLLMNDNDLDIFDFFTTLHKKTGYQEDISPVLTDILTQIAADVRNSSHIHPDSIDKRMADYQSQLANALSATHLDKTEQYKQLTDSFYTILKYAELDSETSASFHESLRTYRNLTDRNATDDKTRALRLRLTKYFHTAYRAVVHKSLDEPNLPIVIKMFLTFGYMDEELAGIENACHLHDLCQSMDEHPMSGVYTFYEWLCAIYHEEREPSRNEFDEDYQQHLHALRVGKKISDSDVINFSKDSRKKVDYELDNFFLSVNKITYGQISTYCPIFSEQNVLKPLDKSYVTPDKIQEIFDCIRGIDYSAFYRESLYTNPKCKISKEYIHVEILPDMILMPNMGIRGVMWQEIEGRKRTTPARMAISIFQMEDLYQIILRMTAEYRWEMCKRVQGGRWNDLGDPSLTSEYVDYIQFYRKNHELSTDAKEKVKSSLQKNKNNFKEMFIQDYLLWILYESAGSPRLNKVARSILFTYCPFPSSIRDSLSTNPLYQELLNRYLIKRQQKLHHWDNLFAKLKSSNSEIPDVLTEEYHFIQK